MIAEWIVLIYIIAHIGSAIYIAARVDEIRKEMQRMDVINWICTCLALFYLTTAGLIAYLAYWRL